MNTDKKGQAILELAIFGSILIMLLGVLINYGLKYNFQHQVMQQTFRKALNLAADPEKRSASYQLLRDRHITNPADSFGIGSVAPFMSSSSVVLNYQMHETPKDADALPRVDIEIMGSEGGVLYQYKTAAFRDEYNVSKEDLGYSQTRNYQYGTIETENLCDGDSTYCYKNKKGKYDYIYGSRTMGWWIKGRHGCDSWDSECADGSGEPCTPNANDPEDDCVCEYWCDGWAAYDIRIIDDCAGQIVEYGSVKRRCYKISQAGIHTPWYCDGDKPSASLFAVDESGEPTVTFGLQSDYDQTATTNNILKKTESNKAITTTDTIGYQNTTARTIIYSDNVDALGESQDAAHANPTRATDPVTSTTSVTTQHTWPAAW